MRNAVNGPFVRKPIDDGGEVSRGKRILILHPERCVIDRRDESPLF